jgi:hypothetical protein
MSPNELVNAIIREGSYLATIHGVRRSAMWWHLVDTYRRQCPHGIDIVDTCGNLGSSVKEASSETPSVSPTV